MICYGYRKCILKGGPADFDITGEVMEIRGDFVNILDKVHRIVPRSLDYEGDTSICAQVKYHTYKDVGVKYGDYDLFVYDGSNV